MPLGDTAGIFGRLITRRDVSNAVVQFLSQWVPTYIGQLEQQAQLPSGTVPIPPDPKRSYRGGLDFDTWMPAWSPVYIVVAQPVGRPELTSGGGSYHQLFDVQVACNYQYDGKSPSMGEFEEEDAIQYADILGMAACAAMLQQGTLGTWPDGSPISTRTRLSQYPLASFPYPMDESSRRVCRSRFSVECLIASVVTESDGPLHPILNPYPNAGDFPTVKSTNVNVDVVPDTQPVPVPASPAQVEF